MADIINSLQTTATPNLPLAPKEYDPRYNDQNNNVLRLFFNRAYGALSALIGPRGGQYLNTPHGAFSATVTQSQTVINTPKLVSLNATDFAIGMYLVAGDGIHVEQPGIYNVQFSAQLTNNDTQAHDVDIWIRKSGVDFPYSASVVTVPSTHGGQPGYYVVAANFFVDMMAGDYVEFWWASNSLQTQINTLPAITTPFASPGAPGFVATVSFVSTITTA